MKRLIVSVLIALVVITIVFGVITGISFFNNQKTTSEKPKNDAKQDDTSRVDLTSFSNGEDWFFVTQKEDLTNVAQKYNCTLTADETTVLVNDVKVYETAMQFDYISKDEEEEFEKLVAVIPPFLDEYQEDIRHTGAELKEKTQSVILLLEKITGAEIGDAFYVISDGELLDNQQDASYESVLAGEATVYLSIRYKDGTYWALYSTFYENHVRFELTRYYDPVVYSDSIVNVEVK